MLNLQIFIVSLINPAKVQGSEDILRQKDRNKFVFFVFSFRKAGSKTTVMNIIRASAANLFLITLRVCLVFSNWLAHLKWPY